MKPHSKLYRKRLIGLDVAHPASDGSYDGALYGIFEVTWYDYTYPKGKEHVAIRTTTSRGPAIQVVGPLWKAFVGMFKHYEDLAVAPGDLADLPTSELNPRFTAHLLRTGRIKSKGAACHNDYVEKVFHPESGAQLNGRTWTYPLDNK